MKSFVVFGGTGSIGIQTLDIIREKNYKLLGFTFNNNIEKAIEIIKEFKPLIVGINKEEYVKNIRNIDDNIIIIKNDDIKSILEYNYNRDDVLFVNALSGSIGLLVTYEILNHKHNCLLANKESLVMAGSLIMEVAKKNKVKIIPIDSEHSGLQKILEGKNIKEVKNLVITASGGALRDYPLEHLNGVTAADALKHPNWLMGKDITINCATMMNKGFEVIEACHLFNFPIDRIKVLIHKESLIHAAVEFNDGTIEANLGAADMRGPISYAIEYPHFVMNNANKLNLFELKNLSFDVMDLDRYPCFKLAIDAFKLGRFYPTILLSANEAAVKLFLNGEIGYLDIYRIVKFELASYNKYSITKNEFNIQNIIELDKLVKENVYKMKGREY